MKKMRPPDDFELEAFLDHDDLDLDDDDDVLSAPDAPLAMMSSPNSSSSPPPHSSFGAYDRLPKWLDRSRPRSWLRALPALLAARAWPVVRPRLTWRYVLASAVGLYVCYCLASRQPLLASNLPGYTGPHGVGAVDVEVALPGGPVRVSDATLRGSGEPAFEVETVLATIYYPTSPSYRSSRPRYHWIPKPVSLTAAGYARLAHVDNFLMRPVFTFFLWAVGGGITIPAEVDAPLLEEGEPKSKSGFPVMVFSHGMASSRTDYTNLLGELASRGHVVAAVEHRDGSCPGSLVRRDASDEGRRVLPLRLDDLQSDEAMDTPALKRAQLAFRDAEMLGAVRLLQRINAGEAVDSARGTMSTFPGWAGRLDLGMLTIAGHSYGATGALQALSTIAGANSTSPSSEGEEGQGDRHGHVAAAAGIILDPGKGSGPLNNKTTQPLLVIHSNSWSKPTTVLFHGRPHFDTVRDLAAASPSPAWFLTSLGTSHPSVTDAPLLEPLLLSWTTGAGLDVKGALGEYVAASADFLGFVASRSLREGSVLAEAPTHLEYDKWVSERRRNEFPKAMAKRWEVHVSGAGKAV